VQVCRATPADLAALHDLVESAYRGESARAGWSHEADLLTGPRTGVADLAAVIASPGHSLLLAERGGTLLGTVTVADLGQGRAYLSMLAVSPPAQAEGLGRLLVSAAAEEAKARFAARTLELTVIAVRTELIDWYRRRGFACTGERRPFPVPVPDGEHLVMVVMERDLD